MFGGTTNWRRELRKMLLMREWMRDGEKNTLSIRTEVAGNG